MTDHSEARERALDEALTLIRKKFGIGGIGWLTYKQSHEAAFEAGRRSLEQERWISVEERPVPKDKPILVTNRLGEVCPLIRDIIQNWVGTADWTWGEPITHWMPNPGPPVHKGDS